MPRVANTSKTVKSRKAMETVGNKVDKEHHKHPSFLKMIQRAIAADNDRKGCHVNSIYKYLMDNYQVDVESKTNKLHMKKALQKGVDEGTFVLASGNGLSGHYRLKKPTGSAAKKQKARSLTRSPAATRVKSHSSSSAPSTPKTPKSSASAADHSSSKSRKASSAKSKKVPKSPKGKVSKAKAVKSPGKKKAKSTAKMATKPNKPVMRRKKTPASAAY